MHGSALGHYKFLLMDTRVDLLIDHGGSGYAQFGDGVKSSCLKRVGFQLRVFMPFNLA